MDIAPATHTDTASLIPPPPGAKAPPQDADLDLDMIDVDPEQPRRYFDEAKLLELAGSIRAHGVQMRVKVRRRGGRFLLVYGERRWRASNLEGPELDAIGPKRTTIPATIEELTDSEVRDLQLIENGQRADLHPLEEADAFKAKMEKDGDSVKSIAGKIQKSPGYVHAKLKLCTLAAAARQALLDGRLTETHVLKLAQVPANQQDQATRDALGESEWQAYDSDVQPRELDVVDGKGKLVKERQPLSSRQLEVHLQRRYMRKLSLATFKLDDAELIAEVGACGPCPHRSGNQLELAGAVRGADLCTNPTCFTNKTAAHWDIEAAAAIRDGKRVLTDQESTGIFDHTGTRTSLVSKYVDPVDALPFELKERSDKASWAALVGGAPIQKFLVRDGAGAARTLIDRSTAEAAAIKAGTLRPVKKSPAKASGSVKPKDFKEQQRKAARALEVEQKAGRIAQGMIAEAAALEGSKGDERALARHIACGVIRLASSAAVDSVVRRRNLVVAGKAGDAEIKALEKYVDGAEPPALRGLVVELLAAGSAAELKDAAELLGVDLKAAKATAAAATKAEEAEAAKKPDEAPGKRAGKGK